MQYFQVLSLLHTRTLELEEGVLDVRISPNSKFVAVALMDSTVKMFFLDTFKVSKSVHTQCYSETTNLKEKLNF